MQTPIVAAIGLSLFSHVSASETKQMPVTAEEGKAMTPDAVQFVGVERMEG